MIIADASADPEAMALDLLAQAEHGADSPAVLASDDPEVVEAVAAALEGLPAAVGPITLVECASMPLAIELAEAFAPEHLEVATRDPAGGRVARSRGRARCSWGPTAQPPSATTSRAPTTSCPPGAPRATRRPWGQQRSCGGCRWSR